MTGVRLNAAELVAIDAAATNAMLQLRMGTADNETHQTINAIINVCYYVGKMTERHQHLLAEVERASEAAAAGYQDLYSLDVCCEIYKALARTTPRKLLKRAITRAVLENSHCEETA